MKTAVELDIHFAYGDKELALTRLENGLKIFETARQTPKVKARIKDLKERINIIKNQLQ